MNLKLFLKFFRFLMMKLLNDFFGVIFLSYLSFGCKAELITTGVLVGSAVAFGGFLSSFNYVKCRWYECCEQPWLTGNFSGIFLTFKNYPCFLFSYTLVIRVGINFLRISKFLRTAVADGKFFGYFLDF